ncbi:MAG: DUF2306 domain-containing protein [Aliiglaciecola sp.]|uniref:DUF2306 domain-containing protein n=1 Tax=Aliiglaciecola sp. M165 TaxID=2593649 RepID=UPI00163DBADE|nr:DUF2306 domain-containing protein [Aliiglaciecola sp. M165]
MQTSLAAFSDDERLWSDKLLNGTGALWLTTALIGQWLFVSYIIGFYGLSFVGGNLSQWADVLPKGIIEGESFGNSMIIIHILLPILVMSLGGLQLVPAIRNRFRTFHRVNGRVYLITAVITSITGIYMILVRGTVGDTIQHLITTFNGLLILLFAYFTIDMAMRRNIEEHRKWAMRLFVVVSGVWTFRVMLMFWFTANGGPVGVDLETFTGPAIKIMTVGQFLLPLLILECYFAGQQSTNHLNKVLASVIVLLTTLCMSVGIFAAFAGMWLPRMT